MSEYQRAFDHARAADQVTQAAAKLTGLGEEADIAHHLGLVTDWHLLGPFDAPEYTGFTTVFPPERQIDLDASYRGKSGDSIRWVRRRTTDALGQLNLIEVIAPVKEAVGYAYSELVAPRDFDAQLRCGADDNCTVWLNGERVLGREQWLNGTRFDRFVVPLRLREGKNSLLVKVCQGPFVPSPLLIGDNLYLVDDKGIGTCLDASTGHMTWRKRFGGAFTASPVAGDGRLYFCDELGKTIVVSAEIKKFRELARNQLDEPIFASPAISQGRLFIRTTGHLYCIGASR